MNLYLTRDIYASRKLYMYNVSSNCTSVYVEPNIFLWIDHISLKWKKHIKNQMAIF